MIFDPSVTDVTYENAQARERTQILMDLSNEVGGFVIGTGDLSELALGWATYNADHMSMYGVNAGVPKTLVRHLVAYAADVFGGETAVTCATCSTRRCRRSFCRPRATARSHSAPRIWWVPTSCTTSSSTTCCAMGSHRARSTAWRAARSPRPRMAARWRAPPPATGPATILYWLRTFYRRFFAQQFKRSCLPDGPKVGSVSVSPRGDWRMPSDASAALWLEEIDSLT